ncbi:helix-turn-helix domain-containing protein [Candidatus Woesearchaeota archaeon]|nr:helix-turn-helix domain-containing protein [Candidatus Woesearchaeota archaeon]
MEPEFWSKGSFAQSMSPTENDEKMKTFHMRHDEDMRFTCRKCGVKISAHNQDWHDGMCDDCFFAAYFPDDKKSADPRLAQVILHAVDNVQLGKHKLAWFLKGSRSKEISHLVRKNVYGGLLWHDIPTIEGFIEQLESMDLIARKELPGSPYGFSVYALTDAGRKAMDERLEISLQEIKKQKPITVGESEKQTLSLFKGGKSIPEIAKERGLAESTIYTHLYRLIVHGHLHSNEVMPEEIHAKIGEACSRFEKRPALKEIKSQLPAEISYDQIRCVVAEYYGG